MASLADWIKSQTTDYGQLKEAYPNAIKFGSVGGCYDDSGTVLLGSLLASQSLNANIIVFLLGLYIVPYVLYSI